MRTLRRVLGRRFGMPAPRFLLEIGSALIRTETELVLKSRWVTPERLLAAGFEFEHPGARARAARHPPVAQETAAVELLARRR